MIFDNKESFLNAVKTLEGKRFELTLKEKGVQRSSRQHRTYWLYCEWCEQSEWAKENGWEKEDFHEFFKAEFLGMVEYEVDGKIYSKSKSTTKVNRKEFSMELLPKIQRWAAGKNIYLPDPE